MTDRRAYVAYRYSISDIDAWSDRAVDVFYTALQRKDFNDERSSARRERNT